MSRLIARKVKGGLVGCAQASCRRTLPGIWRILEPPGSHGPDLLLGQGWHPDGNGVWSVTRNARNDAEFMLGRTGDARRHHRSHHDAPAKATMIGWWPELPIDVICPWCSARLTLRADVLDVVGRVWTSTKAPCLVEGCPRLAIGRGLCEEHQDRPGEPEMPARSRGVLADWRVPG